MCSLSKTLSSIRLPNFFVNESLYFEDGRNNAAFIHRKTSTSNPDNAGSFWRLIEVLKATKFTTATIKTHCHPSRPTDLCTTQSLGGHVTGRNDHGRQRRESLGTRLLRLWSLFLVFTWRHGGRVGVQNNSEKSLLGIWLDLLLRKTWATFCHCFYKQRGCLIT